MHDEAAGPPRLLFVQRAAGLAFAPGAYVFPGGRVDPEDRAAAARLHPHIDSVDAAARIAALRETSEETGIVPETSADDLISFARWLPQHEAVTRRFDTRFYLAVVHEMREPTADGTESSRAFWATAQDVLNGCRGGDGRIIFPTRRLLERLARFRNFAEARAEAEQLPQRVISPWVEHRDGRDWLCIPDDAGYPVTAEQINTALRY